MKVTSFALFAVLALGLAVHANSSRAAEQALMLTVYKTPTCGCCAKWVEHMKDNGFTVHVTDLNDLSSIKARHNVPAATQTCHTGVISGYVVEGHVPASDVKRMLKERPAIAGIAVPGMPAGSPGMEVPGIKAPAYQVLSFDKRGQTRVFAQHGR